MNNKPKRFMAVADNHGDMQDDESVKACLEFKKDFKPDIKVHLGDNWDFRNLRRAAGEDEKASSMEDDWDSGIGFFNKFFEGGGENHFLLGNHDDRMWQASRAHLGLVRDYGFMGIDRIKTNCRKLKVKMYPYDAALGVYRMGKLKMIHGYHAGTGAARNHANVYGNCIFGHVHTQESAPVASLEPAEARSIGCLCKRDMTYANAQTGKLKWANGWAYGFLFENGTYQLYTTRKINGSFHAATEIKTY